MLKNRLYVSVVGSHFMIDFFNGLCGVVLAVLSVPLNLSNTQVATAITLYTLVAAVTQPMFGIMGDRLSGTDEQVSRAPLLLIGLSVAWMAVFFAATAVIEVWGLLLLCFLLAGLGSGLFHPLGTAYARLTYHGTANMGTALFFLVGQMGLALGPAVGGLLLTKAGMAGIFPIAVLALLVAGMVVITARGRVPRSADSATPVAASTPAPGAQDWRQIVAGLLSLVVLAFVVLVALRASLQAVYQFLLPKLFEDRGWEPALYGLLAGTYMGTAALGNVALARLADRVGIRAVVIGSLLLSVPVGLFFLTSSSMPLIFAACAVVGLLTGGQHSIIVVHAQNLLPVRKGLAAGLILGFTFGSGAVGVWLCGLLADIYTLNTAMQGVVLLALPAAALALLLPGHRRSVVPGTPAQAIESNRATP